MIRRAPPSSIEGSLYPLWAVGDANSGQLGFVPIKAGWVHLGDSEPIVHCSKHAQKSLEVFPAFASLAHWRTRREHQLGTTLGVVQVIWEIPNRANNALLGTG